MLHLKSVGSDCKCAFVLVADGNDPLNMCQEGKGTSQQHMIKAANRDLSRLELMSVSSAVPLMGLKHSRVSRQLRHSCLPWVNTECEASASARDTFPG